jgi:DNA-binding NarL/FixJ family response regulator
MIRVVICTGVKFYREGLAEALPKHAPMTVVASLGSTPELSDHLQVARPDVVVLDEAVPHGVTILSDLKRRHPDVHFVVIAVRESIESVVSWAEAGASNYASRDDSIRDLAKVIVDSTQGRLSCSDNIAAGMMRRLHTMSTLLSGDPSGRGPLTGLTPRESEIVELLHRGMSNKGISKELGISVATTKNHVHSILSKLDVGRRGEAAAVFRRWNGGARRGRSRESVS